MKKISVITVNFNQPEITEVFIASMFDTGNADGCELIVVDNGSRENHVPEWRRRYPLVKFIRSEKNLGFAGGNNLAIKEAEGEYLFLINNDTEFTPGLIASLAQTLDDHLEVGMVSPKIRYYHQPELLQYAGFTPMNYYTCRNSCIGQFEEDNGQYDLLSGETAFVHGAAMMVRRAALEKAGLMSEVYFLYYEEMDWCERMRKAGYKMWINLQALVYHKESVSVGGRSFLKEYFMNRNRLLFIRRNCSLPTQIVFWLYFTFVVGLRNIINYIVNRQFNYTRAFMRALAWNFTNNRNSLRLGYSI